MRRLAKSAVLYLAAYLAPRVLRLVLVPLVVIAVGFETYGVYVLATLLLPFVIVICDSGAGTAALRLAPHEDEATRRSLFATLYTYRIVVGALFGVAIVLLRRPLAAMLTGSAGPPWAFVCVAAMIVPTTLLMAFTDRLRGEERHALVAGASALRDVLEAAATLVLVIALKKGLLGLLLARLVADAGAAALLAWHCRSSITAPPSSRHLRTLLALGAPIGCYYLLLVFRDLDRYLIEWVLGVVDAARYDLALRIVGPVALGNAALSMVLEPHVYRTYAHPEAGASIASFLRTYVVLFGTVAFVVSALAPEIFPVLSRDPDLRAAIIAPSLIFAFVGDGVLRVAGIGADLSKRTSIWIVVATVHIGLALPSTYFLLRPLGILAAGLALLSATLVSALVAYRLSRRVFPLELPVVRALAVVIVGVTGATLLVGGAGAIAPLPVRLVATLLFVAIAWAIATPDVGELRLSLRETRSSPSGLDEQK